MAVRIQDATTINKLKVNADGSLNVTLSASPTIDIGTVDQGTANTTANAWPVKPTDGTNSQQFTVSGEAKVSITSGTLAVTQSGTWNITNVSGTVSLPTGASTSALQTTGNSSLATIATNTPPLGQALAASSSPVVLPVAQITALTPLSTVTVTQGTGTNLHVVVDTLPSIPAGSNAIGSVSVSNFPGTQTVSGTVTANAGTGTFAVSAASLPLPSGASTAALQTTGNTSLNSIDTKLPTGLTISSTRLLVDGSGVTQPVSAASLPLPTGAATAAKQPALGVAGTPSTDVITVQGAVSMTALKVDGSAVTQPVSGTVTANQGGTWNLTNISGTISLPTGAATSALQTTGNTSLSTIATNTTSLVVTQGSTTSGQSGSLAQGAVTTAAPSYTTAQTSPLSLKTTGDLRVDSSAANALLTTIATNTGAQATDTIATGTISALNGTVIVSAQGTYTISASITGTWVGTLVAEGQLADNTWVQLPMYIVQTTTPYPQTLTVTTNSTLLITGGGYTNIRMRASSYTSGTIAIALDASLAQQTVFTAQLGSWSMSATQSGNWSVQSVPVDGSKATYMASNSFTSATTATDIFTITGSASKTIRVTRILISGIQTTTSAAVFQIIKRSAANTGGTSSAVTAVPLDSTSSAATATVLSYTANPSGLGTAVGTLAYIRKEIPTAAFGNSDYIPYELRLGNGPEQAIVLRGTSQVLAVSGAGVTLAGNVMTIAIQWTEE